MHYVMLAHDSVVQDSTTHSNPGMLYRAPHVHCSADYCMSNNYYCTLAKEGPLWNVSPPPTLGLIFRSNVYSNMRPCVAASSNGWFMTIKLRIAYVRSINNMLNSCKTKPSFYGCLARYLSYIHVVQCMPRFSTNIKMIVHS